MYVPAEEGARAAPHRAADPLDRVGCSLLTFRESGLGEALDRAKAHGFTRVDLGVVPGRCDHVDLLALSGGRLDALAQELRQRDLEVSSINLHPGNMAAPDFDAAARLVRAAIDVTRHLGARVLTLPPGQAVPDPAGWEAAARVVADRVRGFVDAAEQAGIALSIEAPHANTLAADVAQAARLFALVGDPRVGCTFDTSHVQRGNRAALVDALPKLGVRVVHVHLRDTRHGEVTLTPGKGDCDYLPFLRAMLRDGYGGDFNFELEYKGASPQKVDAELAFAREHLRRLLGGERLPFAHRMYQQPWFRAFDGVDWILHHPKDFIIARPRLKAVLRPPVRLARHARANWVPYRTTRYEAGWRPVWRMGKTPSTIPLRRAAPAAGASAKEIRVALLGCGYTGRYEHGPGFARLPGVKVVGVCDVRPERAQFLGDRLKCPSFTDAERLLTEVRPALVVNCTREWQHRDTTLASLAAGADVFCEKMLAESLESGEAMVRAAREKGRVLGVNYNWRFLPGIQRLRELAISGELGKLRMLRILAHAWCAHHALDLARFLAGEIASVSALYVEEPELRGLSDWNPYTHEMLYLPTTYAIVSLQTKDGVGVSLASSTLLDPKGMQLSVDAVFQEGTVTLCGILDKDAMGTLTGMSRTGKTLDLRMRRGDAPAGFALSFQRSIEAFAESWRSGGAVPSSGEDALQVMRIEHAIVRSQATGARVVL